MTREQKLAESWKAKAVESREEAGRIRRTIKAATDAEAYCNVRAEVWDKCAEELLALSPASPVPAKAEPPAEPVELFRVIDERTVIFKYGEPITTGFFGFPGDIHELVGQLNAAVSSALARQRKQLLKQKESTT